MQLLEYLCHSLSEEELELFWVHCWLIWHQRNMLLHGGKVQDRSRITTRATDLIEEFKASRDQLAIHVSREAV